MKKLSFSEILLVSDLDGTLITDKGVIPTRNIEAIERFVRGGGRFAFATGRSVLATEKHAARVLMNAPSIVYNGGAVYDFASRRLIWSEYLPKDYGVVIRKVQLLFPGVGIDLYSGDRGYVVSENEYTKAHIDLQGISPLEKLPEDMPADCNKVLIYGDSKKLADVSAFLKTAKYPFWEYAISAVTYCVIQPEGISKGAAVNVLADMLGISRKNIFSIGDYYNDIELLKTSATAAVPIDAPEDMKALADIVVGRCEDGAVADFIEHIEARFR